MTITCGARQAVDMQTPPTKHEESGSGGARAGTAPPETGTQAVVVDATRRPADAVSEDSKKPWCVSFPVPFSTLVAP